MTSFVALGMRSEGHAPQKRRTNSWFLFHDNAPANRSVLLKYFLAKKNAITLQHFPCSPDLAKDDFYLFP
jgi:hypothetical protein